MTVRWIVIGLFALSGCGGPPTAVAHITGTSPGSKLSGTAIAVRAGSGVHVIVTVMNAPPGTHGFHIHETGNCGEGGKAAGGHFNPEKASHGFLPRDGFSRAHAGDLGNLTVDSNGRGHLELTVQGLTVGDDGPHDILGRAIIMHEKMDDFGQPTGNAGGRIGCGVITKRL